MAHCYKIVTTKTFANFEILDLTEDRKARVRICPSTGYITLKPTLELESALTLGLRSNRSNNKFIFVDDHYYDLSLIVVLCVAIVVIKTGHGIKKEWHCQG